MRLLINLILFLLITTPAWATTYYVRDGGGTATQCTGTTNATYPGSGSGVACAFNHPRIPLGYDCTNGGGSCGVAGLMGAGDTLYIVGDSDTTPGTQAQYMIGYDSAGSGAATPSCSSGFPWDCTLGNLPAGTSSVARTSIIGIGTYQPQLWGNQRPWQIINANNNHLVVQNLEITSHSNCGLGYGVNACNYSGSYPYGAYGEDGIFLGGTDIILTDLYIHNAKRYGIFAESLGNVTFTRVHLIGDGQGGFSSDPSVAFTGTLTWNQPIVEWSGCEEAYPLSGGIDNPSNYSNCSAQDGNDGGGDNAIIADGVAFGATGSQNAGNWTIIGPGSISFNTQDGLDTLHGAGNGTIQIDKMRFEGNAGNQVKLNCLTGTVTNSLIVGDCMWWNGATQAISGGMKALSGSCRAEGNTISYFTTSGSNNAYTFINNTIIGDGDVQFLQNGTCSSSESLTVKNNIVYGGYDVTDNTTFNGGGSNGLITYIYQGGSDGDGTGCTALTITEDYNIVVNHKGPNTGCSGAHDKCGTSPGFAAGTFPIGAAGGALNTYYQGQSAITLLPLSSGSAAIGAGVSGLTYWNTENDYYNVSRASPPTMGGLELNSCAANSYACFFNSDCCGGNCSSNLCTASSTVSGDYFSGNLTIKGIAFK